MMRKLGVVSAAVVLVACSRGSSGSSDSTLAAETPAITATAASASPYPAGRWRLARPDDVLFVLLRLSHILIRHEGVRPGIVSFQLPDWTPSPAAPQRTIEEARALADQLSERLRKNPSEFGQVARELSEDVTTRDLGGVLGVRTATEFYAMPEVLDAMAALKPGEVSLAVETQYGFHIFQRMALPAEQTLSGARILIGYDEAPWLRSFLARGPVPSRSRTEAFRLAQSIYERAKNGEDFGALVQEFSEHRDAARGGDMGAWSTREPSAISRELELLAGMKDGEIHPPLDTPLGVAIIRRVPDRPRRTFAMRTVQQRYTPGVAESNPASPEHVLQNVRELGQELLKDPSRFAALQEKYECQGEEQWIEGRGEAEAEAVLSGLRPGEIHYEPVVLPGAFGIIMRVEPKPTTEMKYSFELPAPEKPDLVSFAASGRLGLLLPDFLKESAAVLALDADTVNAYTQLLTELSRIEEKAEPERQAAFDQIQESMKALLGPQKFEQSLSLLSSSAEKRLLAPRSSVRNRKTISMPVSEQDTSGRDSANL